jgi:hypothetical protein
LTAALLLEEYLSGPMGYQPIENYVDGRKI